MCRTRFPCPLRRKVKTAGQVFFTPGPRLAAAQAQCLRGRRRERANGGTRHAASAIRRARGKASLPSPHAKDPHPFPKKCPASKNGANPRIEHRRRSGGGGDSHAGSGTTVCRCGAPISARSVPAPDSYFGLGARMWRSGVASSPCRNLGRHAAMARATLRTSCCTASSRSSSSWLVA